MKIYYNFSFLLLIFLYSATTAICQIDLNPLSTKPKSEGPIEVQVGYSIINITDINEKAETVDFDGAIYLRWRDKRLAYKPDSLNENLDYGDSPEISFNGPFRVQELYEGWRPYFYIANGIGNRKINSQSIGIYPDGTVLYSEFFDLRLETPMDLRLYPFDAQTFSIFIHPTGYSRDELIFIPNESLSYTWNKNLGIAEWERLGDKITESEVYLNKHDGNEKAISELEISLNVKRMPLHVIFSIIFPMALLVSLTWVVFWLHKQSVSDRVQILFTGILSVVAYYIIIQDSIPKISYLTLIDIFVIESFLILSASVILTLVIGKLDEHGKKELGNRLDKVSRWAFPTTYAILILTTYKVFSWMI